MAKVDAIKARAEEMRKKLREIDKITGVESERSRDVSRKRKQRAEAKTVFVPACADVARRGEMESDDERWLRYYCAELFWYSFTPQQQAMIEAIRNAILYGGDQALAASRGEGKTKLFERLLLKHTLAGTIKFAVLFAATGSASENSLQSMRDEIERNERLCADYPEVCVPVRALEDTPNRAHYQLVTGRRHDDGEPYQNISSRFTWCGHQIIYPNVPGSPSAWGIIATRGLDAAVRGLNIKNRRPEVVGIDDPDTEDTVRSEEQARKLEERIDRGIAGLGGQQRGVARVMLTTLQRPDCVSAWFTDPKLKPSWKGRRFRFLLKRPDRQDLWDEYVQLRQLNLQTVDATGKATDEFARGAHNFYLANREAMDAGSEVANPHRFNPQELPDGTQLEVSALQRYYNEVARIGPEAVATEYDNDPPEERGPIESGITAHRVQKQVNGLARKVIPPGCIKLTQGIDCRKVALHWVVRAWVPDACGHATGHTIDYGVTEVRGTTVGTDEGLDVALKRALSERRAAVEDQPYQTADGEAMPIGMTLVDAGWRSEAIYEWCNQAGLSFKPSMGFGKSSGCTSPSFYPPVRATTDKKVGDQWFLSRRPKGVWLTCLNADDWKAWEHDRWMSDPEKPGALLLFGERPSPDVLQKNPQALSQDMKWHMSFAKHITAEVEVEEPNRDGVLVRKWKAKSDNNHYLDGSVLSNVAASMIGVKLLGRRVQLTTPETTATGWFSQQKRRA